MKIRTRFLPSHQRIARHLEPRQTAKDPTTANWVTQNNCGARSGVDAIPDAVAVRAWVGSLAVCAARDDVWCNSHPVAASLCEASASIGAHSLPIRRGGYSDDLFFTSSPHHKSHLRFQTPRG